MEEELFNTEPVVQEELTETDTTEVDTEEIPVEESLDNEKSEGDTEDTAENANVSEEKPKEDKLNHNEQRILDEMQRRATGEDGDMPDTALADALVSPDKNIHECYRYIWEQAKKQAVKMQGGMGAMIEDEDVFAWAHHYYIEPKEVIDKELKPKVEKKFTPTISVPAKKTDTTPAKGKKKAENPLLKSLAKKGKKKTDTAEPKSVERKFKKGGQTFTITEFSLF